MFCKNLHDESNQNFFCQKFASALLVRILFAFVLKDTYFWCMKVIYPIVVNTSSGVLCSISI